MSDVFINVKFTTVIYDTKKEKRSHIGQMLNDGWKIETENNLRVEFRKSEMINNVSKHDYDY